MLWLQNLAFWLLLTTELATWKNKVNANIRQWFSNCTRTKLLLHQVTHHKYPYREKQLSVSHIHVMAKGLHVMIMHDIRAHMEYQHRHSCFFLEEDRHSC